MIEKRGVKLILLVIPIVVLVLLIPQHFSMPVEHARRNDYNQESFWYAPWGKSGTHKGVDIFAKKGTNLNSPVSGLVVYTGEISMGGKAIVILGPKWRLHYLAHLDRINASLGWTNRNAKIGTVGDSGNAKGKPVHLHYSIVTLIPYFWKIDDSMQGWKKMFYLNPIPYLNEAKLR